MRHALRISSASAFLFSNSGAVASLRSLVVSSQGRNSSYGNPETYMTGIESKSVFFSSSESWARLDTVILSMLR